jgi:hypothetical protein
MADINKISFQDFGVMLDNIEQRLKSLEAVVREQVTEQPQERERPAPTPAQTPAQTPAKSKRFILSTPPGPTSTPWQYMQTRDPT